MKKLLCVVLFSILLLATPAAGASSTPLISSLNRQKHVQVLGRKGRELVQLGGYHNQHEGKQMQNSEEVVMEVKKPAEKKTGWTGQFEDDGKEKGPIFDAADYEGVAMHAGSPPKSKHPKP